jgi:hypothetical protein
MHCARCCGRLRFVGAIDDPDVVRRILDHLEIPISSRRRCPAPPGIARVSFD